MNDETRKRYFHDGVEAYRLGQRKFHPWPILSPEAEAWEAGWDWEAQMSAEDG